MYRLLHAGRFGNGLRQWKNELELLRSGFTGLVGIRGTAASGFKLASLKNMPPREAIDMAWSAGAKGVVQYSEGAPDEKLTIQGEVTRGVGGLYLTFSVDKNKKMRDAMRHPLRAEGLDAVMLLKAYLDANSYQDLMDLLDGFPDHVVEFSTYSMPLGWARQRNTVFWEVRAY